MSLVAGLFCGMPDAYLVLDRQYCVVTANAAYIQLLRVSADSLLGRSVYEINRSGGEAQQQARRNVVDSLLYGLEPGQSRMSPVFRYDIVDRADDSPGPGGPSWWEVRASCVAVEADFFFVLTVSNVSQRIEADENALRERARLRSQARLRQVLVEEANTKLGEHAQELEQVLAFASVGTWLVDVDTGEATASVRCLTDLVIADDTALSRARLFETMVLPDERTDAFERIERALNACEHFEFDCRVQHTDGGHWILVRGFGRYAPDGSLRTIIGFTLDITGRKNDELHNRAQALAEREAREQSDSVARAMDHFISAVSHELRSPLNAIMSWAEVLRVVTDPARLQQAGEAIRRNGRQLAHMVEDLLDSGAITTGKLSIYPQPLDLAALAASVIEDVRPQADSKGLRLCCERLDSCVVLADDSRMRQIIWNLLTNAVKFCQDGRIFVILIAGGEDVLLEVRDEGRGIAADRLQTIFDRYDQGQFQASGGGAGRVGGLGLGLWLVRNIVASHGGTVEAHSAGLGRGATFRVRLPAAR